MSKSRSFRGGRGRRIWMVGATLVAAAAFGVVFIASSGAAPPPACPTPGNFEIDGDMTQHTCATPEDDWDTPNIGVQSTTQGGTYSTSGKDGGNPSTWSSSGSTPDKTNFAQAYATSRVVGGHFFVFVAWERTSTSGTQGYAIEIDNSGANVGSDGTPQPNRGQGGDVFYISSQGSSAPSFDSACTFSSQTTYGKTCTSSSAQAGATMAINTTSISDPLNHTTQPAGGFFEVALDITQLTGIAPSCPGPSAASVYLRSITGQTSNGNLKGYMAPLNVAPDSTCVPPPISTTAQPGGSSAAIGSSQHDDVTVSDGTNPGVGSVEFFLCSPAEVAANGGDCSANGTQVGTTAVTLDANGKGSSASIDGTTTPNDNTPGTYCWRAEFTPGSGDHHYLAGSHTNDSSECFTVVKNSPTIKTTPSPTTVTLPGAATLKDSAVLSGSFEPTGTITFTLVYGGSTVDTETVSVSGNGTYSTPAGYALPKDGSTVTGTYQWNASYSGDSNNKAVAENNDASEQVTVAPASPSVVTTASGPVTLPGDVTFTDSAVVSGGYDPQGTLTFSLSGPNGFSYTQHVSVSGNGTYKASDGPVSNPDAGTYTWSVSYSGDGNNDAATDQGGPAEQTVVSPASPGIVTSQDPDAGGLGLTYKDRAILSGGSRPTGTITFDLYDNPNCTGQPLYEENASVDNGNGTYETANGVQLNAAGTYYWVATYGGDANNQANATGCADEPVLVAPNQPSIVTTPSPSSVTLGTSAVTLNDSADLSGGSNPTGSITFTLVYKGTTVDTESVPVSGNGTYSTPTGYALPKDGSTVTGTYQWNASYSGDANNGKASESNDPLEQVTVKPASPSVVTTASGPVTLPGDVTFTDSAVVSGGYDPQGTLTFSLSGPNGFSYTQQVTVSGNGTYKASDGPVSNPDAGTYTWSVTYAGDGNNDSATDQGGSAEQTVVSPASPGVTTTQDPAAGPIGGTYKDKAILTGGSDPTGTITFDLYDNPNCTGQPLHEENVTVGKGNGTYETANGMQLNDAGTYYWVATYNGDADNKATATGCSDEPVSVAPNQPAVATTQDPASGSVGDTYKDKASLTGGAAPTGTITFDLYDNPNCTGPALYQEDMAVGNGNGTYETANGVQLNSAGTYYWVATYYGDSNNKSAASGCADEPVAVRPAAIHILKTADHAQVNAGEPVGFKMTLWNDGTGDAKGATLTDVLPTNPGLSWKVDGTGSGFGSSCSIASGTLACDPVTVPAGTDKDTSVYWVHISSDTTAATGGDCKQTGLVDNTGKVATSNAGSDQSSASTCVAAPAIHIVKTADKPQVNVGDPVGFTMTVYNGGNGDAHGVTLKDTLPTNPGLSWSVDKQGAGFGSSCSIASGVLSCGPVTVPAGTTQAASAFTVHVTSATTAATGGDCPNTGVVDNTASVTTTNDGSDQSSASTCVQALVDLSVTKSGSPATQVLGGGNITWTMVVTNNGPDTDTGVKLADPMPAGNTFVSATSSQGSCTGGAILSCTIGTMAAGAKVTITLVTTPTTAGNQVNTVNVVGDRPETNTANNTATATVAVTPQVFPPPKVFCVAVSRVNPSQLFVGRKTRLTIHVTRHGKAVKGVHVRIKGPKIDVRTKASNHKGVITRKIKIRKAGILIFSPIASKRCNTKRVGVTNVFTPPVTG